MDLFQVPGVCERVQGSARRFAGLLKKGFTDLWDVSLVPRVVLGTFFDCVLVVLQRVSRVLNSFCIFKVPL